MSKLLTVSKHSHTNWILPVDYDLQGVWLCRDDEETEGEDFFGPLAVEGADDIPLLLAETLAEYDLWLRSVWAVSPVQTQFSYEDEANPKTSRSDSQVFVGDVFTSHKDEFKNGRKLWKCFSLQDLKEIYSDQSITQWQLLGDLSEVERVLAEERSQ